MNKILLFLLIIYSSILNAQVPNQINYQGIARNAVGNVLPGKNIAIRLSIRDGNATGTVVYREVRNVTTSNLGLFSIAIGSTGAVNVTGTIAGINWNSGAKFLQVEIDPEGGSNFIDLGAGQLLSVPYALFAGNAASGTPTSAAGGDLAGIYPNPDIKTNAVTSSKLADGAVETNKLADNSVSTSKIIDESITSAKLAAGVIPTTLPPSGTAGGDLTGSYPNPTIKNAGVTNGKLANNSVTTLKIADASVTSAKLAAGVIPTSLPPNGTAGGDLTGSYPNPTIGTGVITTSKLANNSVSTSKIIDASVTSPKLADNAVTTSKVLDGSITMAKLGPDVVFAGGPPSGSAGGDLSGTYPNPTIGTGVITTSKLADNSIATSKIIDASVTSAKLAAGVIPTSLPPNGTAGGDLTGTYPNPTITNDAITTAKLADNAVTTSKVLDGSITMAKLGPDVVFAGGPPSGSAGGELSGTYPNPTIGTGVITTSKLADNSIATSKIIDASVTSPKLADNAVTTSKVLDGSITMAKLGPDVVFAGGPPSGSAGGELSGTYPNPTIGTGVITTSKLADNSIATSKIIDASVTSPKLADNAVTTSKVLDGSITMAKLGPDVVFAGGPPSGSAGGDLSGTYPNPTIGTGVITTSKLADNSIATSKIIDASVTSAKLAAGVIPTSLPPNGTAGGDLTGTYPNPTITNDAITTAKLADNAVTTSKVLDGSITMAKLGPDVVFAGGSPSGPAGGDLSGTYPNPNIGSGSITNSKIANGAVITPKLADGAVNTNKLADNSVSTSKIVDASVTSAKLAAGVIPTSLPPNGTAGGDLTGSYPNPTIGTGVITTLKLADNSVSTSKIVDASVTSAKLAAGVIPTSLPPNGTAGGDLTGSYPNPTIGTGVITTLKLADNSVSTSKIVDASVTSAKLAAGVIPTSLPPNGTAGGDLAGTYPNPTIGTGVITTLKLADNSVSTSKIVDASVTSAKLAAGVIPTSLPPDGTAGGDLAGTYPNPSVNKLQGITVSNTAPASGQILKFNGTQWAPGADNNTGLVLPYSAVANNALNLFSVSNQGAGAALEGINTLTGANTIGVVGKISSATAGIESAGVRGINNGTTGNGSGVWGSHDGSGHGVYGYSPSGNGVYGKSVAGPGVSGTSTSSSAGFFDISDVNNTFDAVSVSHAGKGSGLAATANNGHGVWGTTYSSDYAGVVGYNFLGGEAILGRTISNSAAAVVGKNDGTFAGVQGIGYADGGTGVLAVANKDGFVNGNALVAAVEGTGVGNPAVFKANGANVARIDQTGKGFFNGGTQVGGADVAEYFDVEGELKEYEPGDVLVISQSSDRAVEKSSIAYSTLVAGVYATKPGLLLTEKNAEQNQLEDMVPMGVIGVIPTKVCLEGGIIKRGDLIVTSSTKGVAMKADPDKVKPGQVIGKALQGFNGDGIGKITVLVSVK